MNGEEKTRTQILGVPFDALTLSAACGKICEMIRGGTQGYVVTPNAVMIEQAGRDEHFLRILKEAALCLPDGAGVILASRILGTPLPERIPGVEIGERMLAIAADNGWSVCFFGGAPGVAQAAKEKMTEKYPGLSVTGCFDGFRQEEETETLLAQIRESGAQLLYVCLGAPKQEKWITAHLSELPAVRAALALGGSLDVYGGRVKRAPAFFRRAGLEWLYRMIKDPSKLARLGDLLRFLVRVLKEKRRQSRENRKRRAK